jgi:hypothetical protein
MLNYLIFSERYIFTFKFDAEKFTKFVVKYAKLGMVTDYNVSPSPQALMYSVCFPDFEKIKVLAVVPYLKKIKVGL